MRGMLIFQVIARPIIVVARWPLLAFLISATLFAFGKRAEWRYRHLLCVVAYAHTIPALAELVTLLLLHIRGFEAIRTPDDLVAMRGLDVLLHDRGAHPFAGPLLAGMTPSFLWQAAVIGGGVTAIVHCRFMIAVCIVILCSLFLNGIEILLLKSTL
jgi:hypothetical protein